MIRHIVLVRFRASVTEDRVAALWEDLHRIETLVPGIVAIHAGRSESPEGIERGYMHGFTVDLSGWDALAAYQAHPEHRDFGAALVAEAEGGKDGILVFDLPIPEEAAPC